MDITDRRASEPQPENLLNAQNKPPPVRESAVQLREIQFHGVITERRSYGRIKA
jgi:hypothetical protein